MTTCPRCRTPLSASLYEGARVETCVQCHGQWLGPAELKHIVDTREKTWDPDELAAQREAPARQVPIDAVRERLPCPSCSRAMEPFNYAGDSGVLLDRCRGCGGIWLDGGELERAQMAVEASDLALGDDVKRFGGRLRELEVREDSRELRDNRSTGAPLITALVNRMLNTD